MFLRSIAVNLSLRIRNSEFYKNCVIFFLICLLAILGGIFFQGGRERSAIPNQPSRTKKRNVWSRNPRSSFRPERKRPNCSDGRCAAPLPSRILTLKSGYEILAVMNVSHRYREVTLLFYSHFAPRIVCLITPKSDRLGKHGPYVSKQTFCVFFSL